MSSSEPKPPAAATAACTYWCPMPGIPEIQAEAVKAAAAAAAAAGQPPPPTSATYPGGCHCGYLAFEVTLTPPLDQGHMVIHCNCSACRRFGYLLVYPERANMRWRNPGGQSRCATYRFNTGLQEHLFCPRCGASVGIDFLQRFGPDLDRYGVNACALNNINVDTLTLQKLDGLNLIQPAGDLSGQASTKE
ncbi:Mss4-like protein [Niveomyces insectorum RCEF 264]|uniref:Mss4-like protein n=1 Tax=Niveomyces insectorum RCEF 264 TaxID=1081102 RepID=A0A167Z7I3_9HYPO|nr:Mss4-like protein [Niveomyces insectorum RCEF 264]